MDRVPIGQGFARDQVQVKVAGNKVNIIAKNDAKDAVQDVNKEVIIPDDVDQATVKICVRPKRGFVVIVGKKTADSQEHETGEWMGGHPYGRKAWWAGWDCVENPWQAENNEEIKKPSQEGQKRKKFRWVERVSIGQGFKRDQVNVKIEDDKVIILAKNNNEEENREVTKHVTIPGDVDKSSVKTRVRPRMGFVVIFGKRRRGDQEESVGDGAADETAMEIECPNDTEESNVQVDQLNEYANESSDNLLGSDNDMEPVEDLTWDVYDMHIADAKNSQKDSALDDQTWVLVRGETEKTETFKLDIDLSPFSPEDVSIKIIGREIKVTASHYENEDGYSVQQKFERKYRLPSQVEAKKVRSKMTLDGTLTISAPASAEKNLVIEKSA